MDVSKPLDYSVVGVLSYGSDSLANGDDEFNREIRILARRIRKQSMMKYS